MTIEIRGEVPPSENAQRAMHFSTRRKLRERWHWLIREQTIPRRTYNYVKITGYMPVRRYDDDNFQGACKTTIRDNLKTLGFIVSDFQGRVRFEYDQKLASGEGCEMGVDIRLENRGKLKRTEFEIKGCANVVGTLRMCPHYNPLTWWCSWYGKSARARKGCKPSFCDVVSIEVREEEYPLRPERGGLPLRGNRTNRSGRTNQKNEHRQDACGTNES